MKVNPANGAIGTFNDYSDISEAMKLRRPEHYNMDLEYEIQVARDKKPFKILPCTICRRPVVVNTFYVAAWTKCDMSGCSGEKREKASVGVAQAGRTEPAMAVNLHECLINEGFKHCLCPAHPDNPDHEMELKSVHHTPRYGPGEWRSVGGQRVWVQIAPGETAMWQCLKCKAVVTYSTTAQSQYKRVNEVNEDSTKNVNGWAQTLGTRDENVTYPTEVEEE